MNYIVTVEDDEYGVWFEEPNGFHSLHEARLYASDKAAPAGHSVVIYSCREVFDGRDERTG